LLTKYKIFNRIPTTWSIGENLLEPASEVADIQVPGASVSLHSLIDLIKEEFWSGDRKLSGELEGSRDGKFRILIREAGTGNSFTTEFYDYSNFDKLIGEAAKNALRLVDTPTLASYYFSIENSTGNYRNIMREVFYSLKNDYDNSWFSRSKYLGQHP
jgi:hypothetical protein